MRWIINILIRNILKAFEFKLVKRNQYALPKDSGNYFILYSTIDLTRIKILIQIISNNDI